MFSTRFLVIPFYRYRTGAIGLKSLVRRGYDPVVTHPECSGDTPYGSQLWIAFLGAFDFYEREFRYPGTFGQSPLGQPGLFAFPA